MLISFIIVVFNEEKVLGATYAAIHGLDRPPGVTIETIAIDGGSKDGSVAAATALGFTQVIALPGANIPACRNAGIKAAHGDWIAFVDADCVLDRSWLIHAAKLMTAHPSVVLGWPAAPPEPGTWVTRAWHAHWMHKNPAREQERGEWVVKQDGFRMITTRNMIMHRSVIERIGGFDETLATGEDTDFVFRATMAGIPAWGLPTMKSVHLGEPDTLRKFFKQQLWHANRKAYKTIMEKSGMKAGGNAPLFAALFLVAALCGIFGVLGSFMYPLFSLLIAPLPALPLGLAARTSLRARKPGLIIPLAVLYGAYGLARAMDLVGLSPHKPSWKAGPEISPAVGDGTPSSR